MVDELNSIIYEKSSTASLLLYTKRLLNDKNYSSLLKYRITQKLYVHPVQCKIAEDVRCNGL